MYRSNLNRFQSETPNECSVNDMCTFTWSTVDQIPVVDYADTNVSVSSNINYIYKVQHAPDGLHVAYRERAGCGSLKAVRMPQEWFPFARPMSTVVGRKIKYFFSLSYTNVARYIYPSSTTSTSVAIARHIAQEKRDSVYTAEN